MKSARKTLVIKNLHLDGQFLLKKNLWVPKIDLIYLRKKNILGCQNTFLIYNDIDVDKMNIFVRFQVKSLKNIGFRPL